MNKDIKLVLADIDLTLRVPAKDLPAINKKAIEDLHENGILFGLASGRSISQIKNICEAWKLNFEPELMIALNGSAMFDGLKQKTYDYFIMEPEWVEEIINILDENNKNYYAYVGDYTVFKAECEHYFLLKKEIDRKTRLAESSDDFRKETVYKFLFNLTRGEEEIREIETLLKPLLEKHKNDYKLLLTTSTCLEIVNAKTSKAFALNEFCNNHNFSPENIMSFGDTDNDNEMLQASGVGVCLLDGNENTKKIADYVTYLGCDEGGFGDFIYKHILNKKEKL